MNKRVLMLHQFHQPHAAHRVFGDAIGADYRHFETGMPIGGPEANLNSMVARLKTAVSLDDYDVVIGEGTTPIFTLVFYKFLNNPNVEVVPLLADETFMKIREQRTHHIWKYILSKPMSSAMSGGVVVGDLCQSWASEYLTIPFEVVHPPIDASKFDHLSDVSPSYEVDMPVRILHVGTVSDQAAVRKKNVDMLAQLVSEQADWNLKLVGAGHDQFTYSTLPGVETDGYIGCLSRFAAEFKRADLYVQASLGDAFPVATLEAMLAGIPTVVTEDTGTREIVEKVDPNLVRKTTTSDLRDGIKYVLSLSAGERRDIGERLRMKVDCLTEQNQADRFRQAIENITS